jgi:D-arabinose 1-dehydrogenase-like Zn-dependent alcohol dehydrogenase
MKAWILNLQVRRSPVIPGHQIVGSVAALGGSVEGFALADRVGVAWLNRTCGNCEFCVAGRGFHLSARIPVQTHVQTFSFDQANEALIALRVIRFVVGRACNGLRVTLPTTKLCCCFSISRRFW